MGSGQCAGWGADLGELLDQLVLEGERSAGEFGAAQTVLVVGITVESGLRGGTRWIAVFRVWWKLIFGKLDEYTII